MASLGRHFKETYPKRTHGYVYITKLKQASFDLLEPEDDGCDRRLTWSMFLSGPSKRMATVWSYGGGYYDRYLADFDRATVSTIYALPRSRLFTCSPYPVKEVLSGWILYLIRCPVTVALARNNRRFSIHVVRGFNYESVQMILGVS